MISFNRKSNQYEVIRHGIVIKRTQNYVVALTALKQIMGY